MKRAVVFLAAGPLAVLAWLAAGYQSGSDSAFVWLLITVLFLFTLTGSTLVGLLDGHLARVLPIFRRAPLTAGAGAVVAWSVANAFAFALFGHALPSWLFMLFGPAGAVYAGMCSLLANDWTSRASE
jgi:hypothetical protein